MKVIVLTQKEFAQVALAFWLYGAWFVLGIYQYGGML